MIVTHFLQKAYRKITEKPTIDKLDSISTPRDGENIMSAIDTLQQMRDALRPSNDQCDAMAMAPGRFA